MNLLIYIYIYIYINIYLKIDLRQSIPTLYIYNIVNN